MKQYKNRVIDRLLADKLEAMGAVLIEGPKCSANRLFERLIAFYGLFLIIGIFFFYCKCRHFFHYHQEKSRFIKNN